MKTYWKNSSRSGSAILVTMMLTFVISIMVAGAILIVEHEFKFSVWSANRAQTLHTAEAGIDFAIAALQEQVQYGYDWTLNGWSKDGTVMSQKVIEMKPEGHTAPDSWFNISLDTNSMIATANGWMSEPGSSDNITRTVQVELEPDWMYRFERGMLGKDNLNFQGNPICDSYNSNDGPYGGFNVSTNCDIGSMSLTTDGIAGGGTPVVNGDVYVTEVGDAVGEFWTGEEFDTLDVDLPPVDVPTPPGGIWEVQPVLTGSSPALSVSNTTRYIQVPEVDAKGGDKDIRFEGQGKIVLLVNGPFAVGTPQSVTLAPNPGKNLSVQIVVNGASMDMLGDLNHSGNPIELTIEGTANCTDVTVVANDEKKFCLYAPSADITLGGTAQIYGSIVGSTIDVQGTFDFHYDEALATNDAPILAGFVIKSWQEL